MDRDNFTFLPLFLTNYSLHETAVTQSMNCCTDITRGDLKPAIMSTDHPVSYVQLVACIRGVIFIPLTALSCDTERGSECKLCMLVLTCQPEKRNIRLCYY